MKKLFGFAALTLATLTLTAAPISEQKAQEIAQQFAKNRTINGHKIARVAGRISNVTMQRAPQQTEAYYVFNYGDNNGFVVVAGDDRARQQILGFADEGTFCYDSLPANVRWWFDQYEQQLLHADEAETIVEATRPIARVMGERPNKEGVYLMTCTWAQGDPYNLKTPIVSDSHCATGCVATAWSQLMYSHKYPAQGTGTHGYYWNNTYLSTSFSTPYDWDNMLDNYDNGATTEQRNAVAQLMSDAGIASQLNYGVSATGGNERTSLIAMVEHFGYDREAELRYRSRYDDLDWDDMLRENLDKGLPMYYGGFTKAGDGHAFVCDGYWMNMFHFNWGWGGRYNGYFVSSALQGNYNEGQCAVFKFHPDQGGREDNIFTMEGDVYSKNGKQIRFGSVCTGLYDSIKVEIGLFLENLTTGDTILHDVRVLEGENEGDKGWGSTPFFVNDSLAAGIYKVSIHYRRDSLSDWRDFYYKHKYIPYFKMEVDSSDVRTILPYDGPDRGIEFEVDGLKYRITSDYLNEVCLRPNNYTDSAYTIPGWVEHCGKTYQVTMVADSAFMRQQNLRRVKIGEGVRFIGKLAFSQCKGLREVSLPSTLEEAGSGAFTSCSGLKKTIYHGDVATWCGLSFPAQTSNPMNLSQNLYLGDSLLQHLLIPDSVSVIKTFTFYGDTCLRTLTLPNNPLTIELNAFGSCTNLRRINGTSPVPPTLSGNSIFPRALLGDIHLWLPCDYSPAYYNVNIWNDMVIHEGEYEVKVEKEGNGVVKQQVIDCENVLITAKADKHYHTDFDSVHIHLVQDTTIRVVFEINHYAVRFWDDTTLLATDSVEALQAAVAPEPPLHEGYTFAGWDKFFTSVTGDMDVYARYTIIDAIETITNVRIEQTGKTVSITCEQEEIIALYSADGRLLTMQPARYAQFTLPAGIYLLRINNQSLKLIVQ